MVTPKSLLSSLFSTSRVNLPSAGLAERSAELLHWGRADLVKLSALAEGGQFSQGGGFYMISILCFVYNLIFFCWSC